MLDGEVRLSGQLICRTQDQVEIVRNHLPAHVELTRAEPGCRSFNVSQTRDPLIWQVEERFEDTAAFEAHQQRAVGSEWARLTVAIERRYSVVGP